MHKSHCLSNQIMQCKLRKGKFRPILNILLRIYNFLWRCSVRFCQRFYLCVSYTSPMNNYFYISFANVCRLALATSCFMRHKSYEHSKLLKSKGLVQNCFFSADLGSMVNTTKVRTELEKLSIQDLQWTENNWIQQKFVLLFKIHGSKLNNQDFETFLHCYFDVV